MRTGQNREMSAVHEAAHFVAHVRLRPSHVWPMEVSIEKQGSSLGRFVAEGLGEADGLEQAENEIVVLYAGAAAELLKDATRSSIVRGGAASDDRQAEAVMSIWLAARTKKQRQALQSRLRKRAQTFVRDHWAEVEALATDLLAAGTLDSDEASLIIDAAAGDPDAKIALTNHRALMEASRAKDHAGRKPVQKPPSLRRPRTKRVRRRPSGSTSSRR
jgi:hypothetical protein